MSHTQHKHHHTLILKNTTTTIAPSRSLWPTPSPPHSHAIRSSPAPPPHPLTNSPTYPQPQLPKTPPHTHKTHHAASSLVADREITICFSSPFDEASPMCSSWIQRFERRVSSPSETMIRITELHNGSMATNYGYLKKAREVILQVKNHAQVIIIQV